VLNEAACHKGIWESGGILHAFLTSAIDTGGRVHNQAALFPLKVNVTK